MTITNSGKRACLTHSQSQINGDEINKSKYKLTSDYLILWFRQETTIQFLIPLFINWQTLKVDPLKSFAWGTKFYLDWCF